MGKSDRAAAIGLLAFCLALGLPGGAWLDVVMLLLSALALFTAYRRASLALEVGE
jgi:CDP-diacylglycerol--glycerol-3-phosphate 3-phosphatidyltransferase